MFKDEDQLPSATKYVHTRNVCDAVPPIAITYEKASPVHIYSSDGKTSECKFKYVPEDEFEQIVKYVKRKKKKKHEDKEWLEFLRERKKECKCNKDSESVMPSVLSKAMQNDPKKFYNADLDLPGYGHMQDCQEHYDAVSLKAVSKTYRRTMLDVLDDMAKKDIHGREDIVSFLHKPNKKHLQMVETLSETKYINHNNNTLLEPIQEEPLCLPDSQYSMLNGTECIYQQWSFDMNKSYRSDKPKSNHEHYLPEKTSYHVSQPAVPKLHHCGTNKESIQSQKIRIIWKKMDAAFDGILHLYGKIPEPNGIQDFLRRREREAEFSSRFTRNYLYPLKQQVCELKKQIGESSTLSRAQHTRHQALCKKLVVAHQTALQGLQAYLHHMLHSVQCAAHNKLKDLVHYINEVSRLCKFIGIVVAVSASEPGPDNAENKSKALLQLINNKHLINKTEGDLLISHDTPVSVMCTTGEREWESSLRKPRQTKFSINSTKRESSVSKKIYRESASKLAVAVCGYPYKKQGSATFRNKRFTNSKVITKVSQEIEKKLDGPPLASMEDMKVIQVKNIASQPLQQSKSDNSLLATRQAERKIIKIGPRNAQLICLPPDEEDTRINHHESGLKSALTLPLTDMWSAIVYRQKFHGYMQFNPMYRGTPPPWAMVDRLSDHLIDQVLQEVTSEMELVIESLIKNIFTLEFGEEKVFLGQS